MQELALQYVCREGQLTLPEPLSSVTGCTCRPTADRPDQMMFYAWSRNPSALFTKPLWYLG